jgi:hypothetical protein
MGSPRGKGLTTPLEVSASGAIAQLTPRRELGQSVERKRALVGMSGAAAAVVYRAAANWRLKPIARDTAPSRRCPVRVCCTDVSSGSRSTPSENACRTCEGIDELAEAARTEARGCQIAQLAVGASVFSSRQGFQKATRR